MTKVKSKNLVLKKFSWSLQIKFMKDDNFVFFHFFLCNIMLLENIFKRLFTDFSFGCSYITRLLFLSQGFGFEDD